MATVESFRSTFPEFSDSTEFTDDLLNTWLTVASKMLEGANETWGDLFDTGVMLLAAHNIALSKQSAKGKSSPGQMTGPVSSKSVGGLSISYSQGAQIEGAGHYNLTIYGPRYLQLVRMFGAGGVQF